MNLPVIKTDDQELMLIQTKWKSIIDPVLANPTTGPTLLVGVKLSSGANIINHRLGRVLQGWVVTDIDSAITLYRSAPASATTLTLTASGPATCNLMVF